LIVVKNINRLTPARTGCVIQKKAGHLLCPNKGTKTTTLARRYLLPSSFAGPFLPLKTG